MNIVLKSATIYDQKSQHNLQNKDIKIENGIITSIDDNINDPNFKVFSAQNLSVSQGWADSSVSFGEPGFEENENISNGLNVAAKSGFTQVMTNPNLNPITQSKTQVFFLKEIFKNSPTQIFPIGALTHDSNGEYLAELFDMHKYGAVAFGDYKKTVKNANVLKLALQYTQPFSSVVISFPQDPDIAGKGVVNEHITATTFGFKTIPTLAEDLIVQRDLAILKYTGGKLHIPTVSSAQSLKMIKEAKQQGLDVTCSVAIHNIHFTDEKISTFNTNFKVLPPLRDRQNVNAIISALQDGTIDFVTSDHTPLNPELKNLEFDSASYGTIGLESAFGILSQYVSIPKAISLLTAAKQRFNLPSAPIEVGSVANLTIFNPNTEYNFTQQNILSSSKNSAFIGEKLKGSVLGVIANNNIILN